MIKSVLRLVKVSTLVERVLGNNVSFLAPVSFITSRDICTTSLCSKEIRMANEKVKVGGKGSKFLIEMEGESTVDTMSMSQQEPLFPDVNTPNRLFNGVPFKELHIVNIKSTPNNTIMNFTDHDGKVLLLHTSGIEGFKNARKGTNIAAQQTAITLGNRIQEYGVKTVRIRVQGIGAGRMSSIKGLQMAGLNIVSITDDTRVTFMLSQRPRKQRRV